VPADDRADAPLQVRVTGAFGLQVRGDGVDVFGGRGERQERAGAAGQLDHVLQQAVRALGAVTVNDRLERFDPFPGLYRIRIVLQHIVQPVHITPIATRGERGAYVLVDLGVYRTAAPPRSLRWRMRPPERCVPAP